MDMEFLISFTILYIAAKIGKKLVEKIRNPVVEKCLKYAVDPIGECVVAPIRKYMVARIIYYLLAPIGCLLYYNRNIENLRTQLGELRKIRDEVQGLVNAAERNGEVILPRVQKWQNSAIDITEDPMNLLDSKIHLNPMLRYQRSKSAKEKTAEVDQLIRKGSSFDRVSTFESRKLILEKIIEALKDDQTNRIVILGVAGVGKTTLVKEIYEEAIDDKLFDEVVMATVSSDPNLEGIQCEIADMLDLRFEENSAAGRARQLFQRLEEKKRILIILDDIWENVDLEAIGIPFGERYMGCKIVLVSRSRDVCDQSGAEKDFLIQALLEDEGRKLFRRIVGDSVDLKVVHRSFAGLPMEILRVARTFKKRSNWSEVQVAKLSEVQFANLSAGVKVVGRPESSVIPPPMYERISGNLPERRLKSVFKIMAQVLFLSGLILLHIGILNPLLAGIPLSDSIRIGFIPWIGSLYLALGFILILALRFILGFLVQKISVNDDI